MSNSQQDNDPASQALSSRVTALRKKNKLTLDQLAGASGVSRSMLSQIERGQANPTLTVTFRIAQAFGMSIGELVDQAWQSSTIEVVHGEDKSNLFAMTKSVRSALCRLCIWRKALSSMNCV